MNIKELSELRPTTRILVTGGVGLVGSEVLKELYRNKKWYKVKILEQNSPDVLRKLKPYRKDFQLILGDLCDPEVLEKATADVDFVIHLAAIMPLLSDRDTELSQEVNVTGTSLLIQALEKNSPFSFFLYTSSISTYGDRSYNQWKDIQFIGRRKLPGSIQGVTGYYFWRQRSGKDSFALRSIRRKEFSLRKLCGCRRFGRDTPFSTRYYRRLL